MAILRNIKNLFFSIITCILHSDCPLPPLSSSIDLESQQPQPLPSPEVQLASTQLPAAPSSAIDPQSPPQLSPPSAVNAASFQPSPTPHSSSINTRSAKHPASNFITINHQSQQLPPSPLHSESLQSPPPSSPNPESPQPIPQQQSLIIVDLESQQVISDVAQQKLQWQNAILSFCYTSALEISLQFAKTQSKLPLSIRLVSFAILVTIVLLLLAKFISRKLMNVSRVLENVAFLTAAATFCYTTTIPFPIGFKFVIWSIFAVSALILVIYKCFCHIAA